MNKLQIPHECKEDTVLENGMILSRAAQGFSLPERQRMWTAKWIWVSEKTWPKYQNCHPTAFCKGTDTFGVFLFQKRWKCERIPDEAVLYITADTAYKVYINGMAVGRGSAQLGGDYGNCESAPYKCYEAYRVESFIQEGENTITVRVHLGYWLRQIYPADTGACSQNWFAGAAGFSRSPRTIHGNLPGICLIRTRESGMERIRRKRQRKDIGTKHGKTQ